MGWYAKIAIIHLKTIVAILQYSTLRWWHYGVWTHMTFFGWWATLAVTLTGGWGSTLGGGIVESGRI